MKRHAAGLTPRRLDAKRGESLLSCPHLSRLMLHSEPTDTYKEPRLPCLSGSLANTPFVSWHPGRPTLTNRETVSHGKQETSVIISYSNPCSNQISGNFLKRPDKIVYRQTVYLIHSIISFSGDLKENPDLTLTRSLLRSITNRVTEEASVM